MAGRVVIQHLGGSKANRIEQFPADSYTEITIGRDPTCSVVFDTQSDTVVSRRHTVIKIRSDDPPSYKIEDLGSRNGTLLNGAPLTGESELMPDDIVELGPGGPKFKFDIQPRPAGLMARTRVINVGAFDATRVINTAEMEANTATSAQRPTAGVKTGVGKETVQRMLTEQRQATSRTWMYTLAAVLAAVGTLGGGLYYKYHTEHALLLDTLNNSQTSLSQKLETQSAGVDQRFGMSAEDIIHKYGNATIYIEMQWRLYDRGTGKPLYHKMLRIKDENLPCYVELPDHQIVRWLTTDDENRTNYDVGTQGSGSGFVISDQGFILTNKHVVAGWMIPYRTFVDNYEGGKALLFQVGDKDSKYRVIDLQSNDETVKSLFDWVPDNGGIVFTSKAPIPLDGSRRIFEGRDEVLDVRFPGSRLSVAGRLVRASTDSDVAEIKIDSQQALATVELAQDDAVKTGERVTVLGYPGSSVKTYALIRTMESGQLRQREEVVPEPTVTEGLVSRLSFAEQRQGGVTTVGGMGDAYQLSVPAGPGNSGGPVFNSAGKVIGLFTYGTRRESVTFAVPIKYGRDLVQVQRAN